MDKQLEAFTSHLIDWSEKTANGDPVFYNLTPEKINAMHRMAYVCYQNKRYREADSYFRLLVLANPKSSDYWKGLGACQQMNRNYQEALNCYLCAQVLMIDNPDPYLELHSADCHFALGNIEKGLKMLNIVKALAKKNNDVKMINHVAFMRSRWVKKKAKKR